MLSFFSKARQKKPHPQLDILPAPIQNPYFSNVTIAPQFILLHCTGFHNPMQVWLDNGVSTHYYVPEQNSSNNFIAFEVVKVPLRAWHAGVSHWQNYSGLNDYAIGIEINMPNYAKALLNESLDFTYFEAYQTEQITALILLIQQLQEGYSIPAFNIIGHADVAPWRLQNNVTVLGKTDPGPTLPWKQLALDNISRRVDKNIACPDDISKNISVAKAQDYLKQIGYAIENTNVFDVKTNLTLGAYRLHFMPECLNSSTGYATNCYTQPFDSSTVCSMYRVLETQQNQQQSDSLLFWTGVLATGGTFLLAYLALRYLVKRCEYRNDPAESKEDEEDPYAYRRVLQ